jgi:hypothetical protein
VGNVTTSSPDGAGGATVAHVTGNVTVAGGLPGLLDISGSITHTGGLIGTNPCDFSSNVFNEMGGGSIMGGTFGTLNVYVAPAAFDESVNALDLSGCVINAYASFTIEDTGANGITVTPTTRIYLMRPGLTVTQTGVSIPVNPGLPTTPIEGSPRLVWPRTEGE